MDFEFKTCVYTYSFIYSIAIPVDLQDLDALSVLLSQEVAGPPENVRGDHYNIFWLERNATGGYMGCVRKGISSFGVKQTGKLVRLILNQ